MSGKAPPRGPRALLNSLQQSQTSTQQASSSKLPLTTPLPAGPKANVAPPTGPRSLMNGGGVLGSRYGTLNGGHNHKSPLANGHTLARVPPSGPKGKAVDVSPTTTTTAGAAASSSTWVNGKRPPTGPSALRASAALKLPSARPPSPSAPPPPPPSERAPSHPPPPPPPYGHAPRQPPPPPASPPPIPPPPSDVPHLSAPIRLPTSQPQEPRLVPPPLPPPPAIPRPPSLAPPPLPPPLPLQNSQSYFLPTAPISIRLDPRNSRLHTQQSQTSKPSILSPPPPPPPLPASTPPPARPPSPPLPSYVVAVTEIVDGKQKKLYSLRSPPHYPPERSEFPDGRDYKVLYDGSCDKDRIAFPFGESMSAKTLIDTIRGEGAADRIKETNKGKTHLIYRYLGETVDGEPQSVPSDPRKAVGFRRLTRIREDFHSLTYEHDSNSPGPPPPTNVLIIGLPPLTTNAQLRTLFGKYGSVQSFDREIDRKNGAQLGILSIRFSTHEEARRCVTAEDRKTFAESSKAAGLTITSLNMTMGKKEDQEEMRVVLDDDGKKLKAVLDEIEARRKAEKDRKRIQSQGSATSQITPELNGVTGSKAASSGTLGAGKPPPTQSTGYRIGNVPTLYPNQFHHGIAGLPPRPQIPQGPRNMHGPSSSQDARRPLPPNYWRARTLKALGVQPVTSPSIPNGHPQEDPPSSKGTSGIGRGSSDSTPIYPMSRAPRHGLGLGRVYALSQVQTPTQESTSHTSRSPSPVSRRLGDSSKAKEEREAAHAKVMDEIRRIGYDYILIDEAQLAGSNVREEDIRSYFGDLKADKILHDHHGWFITFTAPDAASRAGRVLSLNSRLLANRTVYVTVHSIPRVMSKAVRQGSPDRQCEDRSWSREELVAEAEEMIMKELKALLEKDVTDRVVGMHIRKMAMEERSKRGADIAVKPAREETVGGLESARNLKGLSFRKRKQEVRIAVPPTPEPEPDHEAEPDAVPAEVLVSGPDPAKVPEADKLADVVPVVSSPEVSVTRHEDVEASDVEERPNKRRKNFSTIVSGDELESEGEEVPAVVQQISRDTSPTIVVPASLEPVSKRPPSPALSEEHPTKRVKLDVSTFEGPESMSMPESASVPELVSVHERESVDQLPTPPSHEPVEKTKKKEDKIKRTDKKSKKSEKTGPKKTKAVVREDADEFIIPPQPSIDVPSITEIRVDPSTPWVPSTPPSAASVLELKSPGGSRIKPLSESALKELALDDEDLYFLKLALSHEGEFDENYVVSDVIAPLPDPDAPPPFRKHVTGSARTEGYYKISHAEKSAYVAQYALRNSATEGPAEAEPTPQVVVSSRSNRANARRRAQGLEEINQLQLAVALSKGETGAADVVKFNQLQTRKKHLRFARSPIHDWGLYAMERIGRGEMVIEYVGEIIRAAVADKREKAYERQGIGSSYLFRIDEELVADATKKGNLGRLINHSCDPNCTAKIITINGEKKIVIYAKQDIELGDEITYDYHFPIEQDKIPCLCGSAKCRGFLN